MALVSTLALLRQATRDGYAIGAFNFENMEMAQAIVAAAEETGVPVIMQTTPGTVRYASVSLFSAMVRSLAEKSSARIALHLDHGESPDMVRDAAAAGYNSVMIDGSKLPFEENAALTRSVKRMVSGLPVEGELGTVGGKEDDMAAAHGSYTDPEKAAEFVVRTGVDFLAIAIGTAHGIYKGEPHLDIGRLSQIRRVVAVPLVLHGASGVPDDQVIACIREGISKVNYATELRIAYTRGVKAAIAQSPDAYDPKVYGKAGRAEVQALVKNRIELLRYLGAAPQNA